MSVSLLTALRLTGDGLMDGWQNVSGDQTSSVVIMTFQATNFELLQRCFLSPHLSKGAFPNQRVYFIAVQPLFSIFDDVIIIVVIIAVVVDLSLFLGTAIFRRDLLGSPLLFCIIHLRKKKKSLVSQSKSNETHLLLLHYINKKTRHGSQMFVVRCSFPPPRPTDVMDELKDLGTSVYRYYV